MAKVNLTNKPISEQIRILKDYLIRRSQHEAQGEISLSQIIKRFKHKRLMSDREKIAHFKKLIKMAGITNVSDQ